MRNTNEITRHMFFNRLRVLLLSSLFLVFWGCESLDFVDPNAPSTDNASFQNLVTGTEGAMRINIDQYLQVVSTFGREAYFMEPADPRFVGELLRGPLDPNGFLLNNPWESRYRTIANTEILIQRAGQDPVLTAEEKASATGFAKTIKAYQLLLNLNYTYNNGIVLNISDDVNTPEASKDESFAFIANLLEEGFTELQSAGDGFFFKLSSGFSGLDTPAGFAQLNRALRARVAVYMMDWQTALNALQNSFLDVNAAMDFGAYHVFSTALGDRDNGVFEVPTSSFVKFRAHPSFKTDAEPGDQRYLSKILDREGDPDFEPEFGESELSSTLVITITNGSTDRLPIIRNEELILLRAEANIGLGNFAAAQDDINIVRAAAGLAPVTIDAGNALDQLLHEKRYSLFAEGHRWVDMRRYGKLGELPLDRANDQVFEQWPLPFDEVPSN